MKRLMCLLLTLVLCLSLGACNISVSLGGSSPDTNNEENRGDPEIMAAFAGEWFGWCWDSNPEDLHVLNLTLNPDGTCIYNGTSGTWRADSINFWLIGDFGELIVYTNSNAGIDYLYIDGPQNVAYRTSDFTKVELTTDNWQQYFTLSWDGLSVSKNPFGDIESVTIQQSIGIKEEYSVYMTDRIDTPVVEFTYTTGTYACTVDAEKETFVIGELLEQQEEVNGPYIQGLGAGMELYHHGSRPDPDGVVYGLTDFQILRIQGAIYLVNEP